MKYILTISITLIFSSYLLAQKVFSVEYANQADLKVYVVEYENQADLKVYQVKYKHQAGQNNGKWFFTGFAYQAEKKIFFC